MNQVYISPLAAVGPTSLSLAPAADRPQLHLAVLGLALHLRLALGDGPCGLLGRLLFLLAGGGGLEIINYFIEEVLNIGIGLRGDLLVKLCLLLCQFLGHLASFTQDFAIEIRFVAKHVDLDVLLAGLPDEVDPLGDVLC